MSMGGLGVQSVTVRFGGLVAVDDVTLELSQGEVLGVIGPNGAGKTTLFNVICGFVRPTSGRVLYQGNTIEHMRPHRLTSLGISRTLQGLGLCNQLSVLENVVAGANASGSVSFMSGLLGLARSAKEERRLADKARETLSTFGLSAYEKRTPSTLPYAIQKKVALARALISEPKYLLLDEPASGLSHDEMAELGEMIRSLGASIGVMLVEHHMDLVMDVCDRICVLDFGKLISQGTPQQVKADPAVLDAYLGEEATKELAHTDGTLSLGDI